MGITLNYIVNLLLKKLIGIVELELILKAKLKKSNSFSGNETQNLK